MTGLEPAIPRLEVWCVIQLRYTDYILTRVNRTPDKWIYSPLLYQLSYSEKKKVPPGLEPGSSDSKSEVLTITPRNLIILRKANTVEV